MSNGNIENAEIIWDYLTKELENDAEYDKVELKKLLVKILHPNISDDEVETLVILMDFIDSIFNENEEKNEKCGFLV